MTHYLYFKSYSPSPSGLCSISYPGLYLYSLPSSPLKPFSWFSRYCINLVLTTSAFFFSIRLSVPCTKCAHGFIRPSSLPLCSLPGSHPPPSLQPSTFSLVGLPCSSPYSYIPNYFRRSAPECFPDVTNSA